MTSINTTYAFNSEAAPVSAHDENDDIDDHDHRRMNSSDDCDRDGLFHDHDNATININGHPQSSPHCTASRWWKSSSNSTTICIGIIIALLGINIALLLQPTKSNNHASNAASTTTSSSPPPQKVSSMLYNALIPQWKPLPPSDTIITHIAFGSCASQNMPQSFWDSIILSSNEASHHQHHLPDLFIYTGDNVYGDCSSEQCTELRMAYYNLSLHPSIQGIASQIPIIATLDDHDYGMNNCHAHNPYKDTARDLFREFFNYTWDDLPWHEGVYQSYAFGKENQKVQIILLDTRYGRSPFQETNDNASPFRPKAMDDIDQHMLSEFQWKWLQQQITKEPDVVLRIIISSIQVLNDVTGFEAWRQLPMEQQRLLKLLQNEPVIFISGDRHVGGIYETTKTTASATNKFVEITASSLTHSIPFGAYDTCSNSDECDEDAGSTRVSGPLVRDNHYGTMALDYDASTVTIALRRAESSVGSTYHNQHDNSNIPLHGDAGEILINRTYSFSEL